MAANSGPKSFHDIVRSHRGFLVNPLQWTLRHLDLVGCRFADVETAPVDAESTDNDRFCSKAPSDAEVIALNLFP
ncbi:hypothetical protein N7530_011438 [Penicillium desertorum]|uniref:Uncharacterized protein n=1 Tax=Penicillium desertorum TaxID=1303715 RepID=A0A9X0BFS5_9EURO|nr:hypothetical protein N7530_011438 [Penicillium desertorum]